MRLDNYLASQNQDLTRSQLQQLIKLGQVRVNKQVVSKPSQNVKQTDVVELTRLVAPDFTDQIKVFSKNVIYRDNNVVVINKPTGMLVHAKGGLVAEFTVADYVRSQFNQTEAAEQVDNNRLGIVHRLDRATSGVMICALNLDSQTLLSHQFANRLIHKTYLAVTDRTPTELTARINLPIGRNLAKPATFRVDSKGKSAVTDYQVVKEYPDGKALIELKPTTGRTHQLRVHLAYIHCPITGDPVYGGGRYGDRLLLHAWQLEVSLMSGDGHKQRRIFTAQPAKCFGSDWQKLL